VTRISNGKHALLATFLLIVCLAGFELTNADLWLQGLLFDATRQQWLWSKSEPVMRLLFYDGPKRVLMLAVLGLGLSLLLSRILPFMPKYMRGVRIVFFSLLLVPASVSGLKATTNVACPSALAEFGGEIIYTGLIGQYPSGARPAQRQHCFPAAHASGGFALLALYFLFDSPRNRRRAICLGLAVGWYMGAYKMLIGDHFASHTIVSMLWAWLVINVIVMADDRLTKRDVFESAQSPAA
jgi:membrane-associated PAP2 superfamily phosphatase